MNTHHFNAAGELVAVRAQKCMRQRHRYQSSRLSRYRAELVDLYRAGGSYRELTLWLRQRRIKVSHTTVMRYLKKLPELKEVCHAKFP